MPHLSSLFAAAGLSQETQAIVDALFNALNPPANPLDPGSYWLFWFFCGFSVAFFALTMVLFFVKLLRSQSRIGWLGVSASLLASVWCLRFAVGLYGILVSPEAGLTVLEEIFNSLSHALQTFSMDEDYTEYIINGRTLFAELCGADSVPVTVYGIYASVLNFLAPVAGGALLFEMLASIFPRLRLWVARWNVFSEKIYFSELNEQSLALMKSLQDSGEKKRATYIFTDAYEDKEDEQRSERLAEAKQMGSVCVPDDIAHIVKRGFGKRTYFLIDESEVSNLQTLVDLADENNRYCLKKADVYLFCRGDLYTRIERQVFSALHEAPRWEKAKDPLITPVHSYRNLVSNLLVELPLYEPLVEKKGEKSLNVTILGNGAIGTELFLAVYWMGQILDHKLNVNVVSKDSFKEFWEKIDYINPEIRKTVEVVEALSEEDGKDPVKRQDFLARKQAQALERQAFLRWDTDGSNQSTDPYATVQYLPSDVKSGSFWRMDNQDDNERLLNTDYFIVSLGSDEDNVAIAEKIRQRVGEHHVHNKDSRQKTVIAYVVYDSDLCDTLNRKKKHYSYDPASPDIYMHAFGSRKEVFSYKNIMMTEHQLLAEGAGAGYAASQAREASRAAHRYAKGALKNENNNRDYENWANLGRAMHLKYKVFSAGMIKTSVFMDKDEASADHRAAVEDQCQKYKYDLVAPGNRNGERSLLLKDKILDLAWLEHRRWCAFTRVRGFRRTEDYSDYVGVTGNHKHISLKLHPCLRESSPVFTPNDQLGVLETTLQRVFKNNDKPHCAFGKFVDEEGAIALLCMNRDRACRILHATGRRALRNTFVYNQNGEVITTLYSVDDVLERSKYLPVSEAFKKWHLDLYSELPTNLSFAENDLRLARLEELCRDKSLFPGVYVDENGACYLPKEMLNSFECRCGDASSPLYEGWEIDRPDGDLTDPASLCSKADYMARKAKESSKNDRFPRRVEFPCKRTVYKFGGTVNYRDAAGDPIQGLERYLVPRTKRELRQEKWDNSYAKKLLDYRYSKLSDPMKAAVTRFVLRSARSGN